MTKDEGWIRCSEQLPDMEEEVYILTKVIFKRKMYEMPAPDKPGQWGWFGEFNEWHSASEATHWRKVSRKKESND